jgi:hypothetical protein
MTERKALMNGSFAETLFYEEPAGIFSDGHIFVNAPDITSDQHDPEIGYWHCDIAHSDRLTWSEKVYELFGFPSGSPLDRERAMARYSDRSKCALQRVRAYAISRQVGFILDAEVSPQGADNHWNRVLAISILSRGVVVGVHGLKRAL